ncbi:MAG: UDP-3-O-[3-hydroxymyristoyl] N-acetylglucosamine deacetylase [Candidatus Omnitrophica bacterium]|nr:UDP-3-O-[3-hydroxymyristoyl] N-acetylglucosamine deacetylase [Candidatus Omnitrophota bacterium]
MVSNQRTIKERVRFLGKGLQTGRPVEMVCIPADIGNGVAFSRKDAPEGSRLRLKDDILKDGAKRRTTLGKGAFALQTVEHFLASLWALGIDNMEIEVKGPELPVMDGSALGFLSPLKEAGVIEQTELRREIKIDRTISVEEGESSLEISPADKLSVSYLIDYDVPCIERENFEIELDADSFEKEIAPARTFCLKREAFFLLFSGMGRGANLNNTLVLGNRGPLWTEFRFPNEPVRHKVLDLVGDLYMMGVPVIGKVVAKKSGHSLNGRLVKRIYESYIKAV